MRLAVIRNEVSFNKGGAERYAANVCREWAQQGHEVHVLAETFDQSLHPALIHHPIEVDRRTSARRSNSFHRNAQKVLSNLKVDHTVALSRSFPSDAFRVSDPLHRFWMDLRYPGKIRRAFENMNPRHRAILALEKRILDPESTRLIVTNSELSKTLIGRFYDYPADKIHVIYNGVDHRQFSPDPHRSDHPLPQLLFVGQDFKRKGLSEVLEAFTLIRKAGLEATLKIVGRDHPEPFQRLAEKRGISDYVTFHPASKKIEEVYQGADLFVFPSLYDPFANVVLEALACGLPALTTTTNGSSEVIKDGLNGYVVQGASPHLVRELSEKMTSFLKIKPEARNQMREQAHQTALNYTIASNASQFLQTLENDG